MTPNGWRVGVSKSHTDPAAVLCIVVGLVIISQPGSVFRLCHYTPNRGDEPLKFGHWMQTPDAFVGYTGCGRWVNFAPSGDCRSASWLQGRQRDGVFDHGPAA